MRAGGPSGASGHDGVQVSGLVWLVRPASQPERLVRCRLLQLDSAEKVHKLWSFPALVMTAGGLLSL
jgi:hypothetical protein